MNLQSLWKSLCKSILEGYFQWSESCIVKSDFKSDGTKLSAILSLILPLNYFSLIYNFCENIKELSFVFALICKCLWNSLSNCVILCSFSKTIYF